MVNWLRRLGKNHSFGVAVAPSLTCQKTVDRRLESPMKDLSARPIRWRAGEDTWEIHGHRIKGLNDYYYMLIASIYPKHWGFINGAHGFFTSNPFLILWYSLYILFWHLMAPQVGTFWVHLELLVSPFRLWRWHHFFWILLRCQVAQALCCFACEWRAKVSGPPCTFLPMRSFRWTVLRPARHKRRSRLPIAFQWDLKGIRQMLGDEFRWVVTTFSWTDWTTSARWACFL